MQELLQRLKLRSYAKDILVAPQQPEMNVIEIPEIEYDNVHTQWSLNTSNQWTYNALTSPTEVTGSQNVDKWPNAQQLPPLEPATLTEIPQDSQENQTTRDPENLQLAELRSRTKLTYSDISDTESANVSKKT